MEHCLSLIVSKLLFCSQTFTFAKLKWSKYMFAKTSLSFFVNRDRDGKNNFSDTFVNIK